MLLQMQLVKERWLIMFICAMTSSYFMAWSRQSLTQILLELFALWGLTPLAYFQSEMSLKWVTRVQAISKWFRLFIFSTMFEKLQFNCYVFQGLRWTQHDGDLPLLSSFCCTLVSVYLLFFICELNIWRKPWRCMLHLHRKGMFFVFFLQFYVILFSFYCIFNLIWRRLAVHNAHRLAELVQITQGRFFFFFH